MPSVPPESKRFRAFSRARGFARRRLEERVTGRKRSIGGQNLPGRS
jgi:hypothetical protein